MSDEDSPVATNPTSGGEEAAPPEDEEHEAPAAVVDSELSSAAEPASVFANMNLVDQVDDVESDSDDSEEEEEEDPLSTLPPYVMQRVEKLKELNARRDEIMEQYLIERAALEAKFHGLCEPLFSERADIIKGYKDDEIAKEEPVTDEGDERGNETEDKDDNASELKNEASNSEIKVVGIPQFWVCAMSHMEPLAELITEEDVDCLEALQNITCIDDPDGTGFTLKFHFAPNDYFHNALLTKRYHVPNLLLDDEPILKNVEGCKIQWKSGRSLTYREVTKKQRGTGKKSGMVRTVKKKERTESFFHFFEPPKMPATEDMDEEEADRLEEAFEEDYDVAQAFRSHIIPKAVMWFTGQVSFLFTEYF